MDRRTLAQKLSNRFRRHVTDPIERTRRSIANRGRELAPVFVTGAMGSGTTLLGQGMGERFDLAAVIPESALEISRRSFLYSRAIARFDSIAAYERFIEPDAGWSKDAAVADMQSLYRSVAEPDTADVIVDKAANTHLLRADFLLDCFPDASMVAVFRDPSVNIEGFRRKWPTFGRDSVDENVRFYRHIYEAFLDTRSRLPHRTCVVEYEQLVADPDRVFARLGERLGLAATERRRSLEARPNRPGQGLRNVEDGSIRIVKDANDRSRERLGAELADRIRTALDDLHSTLRKEAADLA